MLSIPRSARLAALALPLCLAPSITATAASQQQMTLPQIDVAAEGTSLEETLPSELASYGAQLEVIDRKQFNQTGMSDVAQALERLVPGLYVSPEAGRGGYVDVSLQGSRTKDVLWLVDGVRINNRLYGSTTPLDSITTDMIERIEVLKGGQGLFYGTQAVAGVINIVLRDPDPEGGGAVTLGAGTLGDQRVGAHVSGQGLGGRWLLFGNHDQSDGYQPYRDEAYRANARRQQRGFERSSVGGKYHYSPGPGRSLQLLALHNQVKADDPGPANNFYSVNDRDETIASLKWDHQVSERAGYYVKAYWHEWWTDFTSLGMDPDGSVNVIHDEEEWGYEDFGVNLTGRYTADGGSQLLAGIDHQRYSGKDYVLRIDGKREVVTAGFFQYRPELAFSPETRLALGARYNHSDFGGDHSIWNISLDQPLTENTWLKASGGTNFILPTAYQLFTIDPDYPVGNEDLDPEESINANLAVAGGAGAQFRWRLGGFYRKIDHLITVENGTFVNSDQGARVSGAEAVTKLGGNTGWQLDLSATYSRSRTLGSDEQIQGIPEWLGKATLAWDDAQQQRGVRLSARYVGDKRKILRDIGEQQTGDYTILDASAYQRFGPGGDHRVTLRLENLTDRRYATRVGQDTGPGGDVFRYETLGVPRNAQIAYSYTF